MASQQSSGAVNQDQTKPMTNINTPEFWEKQAQELANAFWLWAVIGFFSAFFHLGFAALFGCFAAACVVQSFKATARAQRLR